MKNTFQRDDLVDKLSLVSGVVEKRQTLPILGNCLLEIGESECWITATDLEIEVRARISHGAGEKGSFTLSARKFSDICRSLPEGSQITISVSGDKAVVVSGRSRFSLGVLPAEDFPRMDVGGAYREIRIPEVTLKRLIEKTAFAMAQQDVRYYLNGMLFEVGSDDIRTVATDGHRLATWTERFGDLEAEPTQLLVPRKAVLELGRMLRNSEDLISLETGGSFARVKRDDVVFSTKLIDGRYPDWNRVIPTSLNKVAVVDRQEMKKALVRASILSSEKYRGINLSFSGGLLGLSAHNPEREQAEDEVEIDYEGDDVVVGFNVGYLLDVLNVIDSEIAKMEFSDSASSVVIKEGNNSSGVFVVMPMRL